MIDPIVSFVAQKLALPAADWVMREWQKAQQGKEVNGTDRYRCPHCKKIGRWPDSATVDLLACDCGHSFSRESGRRWL